jgi:transposase-like protein
LVRQRRLETNAERFDSVMLHLFTIIKVVKSLALTKLKFNYMNFNFKGLQELFSRFPNDETARQYLEERTWAGVPTCPFCGSHKWYKLNDGKTYKCGNSKCYKKYTVTVNTVFHGSHIPLNIWFAAMYIISSHRKGISSHQLAKDLNVTQKSAWFMLHRLRAAVRDKKEEQLSGIVEVDETYMARKFHAELKPKDFDYTPSWPNIKEKGCVLGMAQRGGNVRIKVFESNKGKALKDSIKRHVKKGSWLFTDGSFIYREGLDKYKQESVIHSKKEYVKGDIYTNNIENFWGVMKRGIYGIYHQVSYKHLQRYCDEYSFRYNNRKLPDNERFALSLLDIKGRLTYNQLTKNAYKEEEPYQEEKSEWD